MPHVIPEEGDMAIFVISVVHVCSRRGRFTASQSSSSSPHASSPWGAPIPITVPLDACLARAAAGAEADVRQTLLHCHAPPTQRTVSLGPHWPVALLQPQWPVRPSLDQHRTVPGAQFAGGAK